MSKTRVTKIKDRRIESWKDAVNQYLWFKKAQGLRETTLKAQSDVLSIFFNRYPQAVDEPRSAVLCYMSEKISPSTYNYRLSYLKSFYDWCIEEDYFTNNPVSGLKKRKVSDKIVDVEHDVLKKLLDMPNKKSFAGLRDYGLIILTLDTGIRPKEAFQILVNDVNLRAMEINIRPEVSKTGISRTLPISYKTVEVIKKLINSRHFTWKEDVPIFCTAEGTMLNRNTWNDRLETYSKKLNKKICPYDLRHVFALEYLRNGGNALALQRIMGHTDLSMTKKYVAFTGRDMKEQHKNATPLSVLLPNQRVRRI